MGEGWGEQQLESGCGDPQPTKGADLRDHWTQSFPSEAKEIIIQDSSFPGSDEIFHIWNKSPFSFLVSL